MDKTSVAVTTSNDKTSVDWQVELDCHERWLRTVIRARSNEPQAVDEIFQEVASAAIAQKSPISDPARVAPWLYQLAVRQSLMYRRTQGRRRKLEKSYAEYREAARQPADDPLRWMLDAERRDLIRQALQEMNRRDAEMLLLKYSENWNYNQIAEHLGMTHSAVESRLHRCRKRLRETLTRMNVVEARKE